MKNTGRLGRGIGHNQRHTLIPFACALLLAAAGTARAQVGGTSSYSNEELIVDDQTEDWTGNFFLGYGGTNNLLVVTNGGVLNVLDGYLHAGFSAGSDHNAAIVSGSGSKIAVRDNSEFGRGGSHNTLTVSNGGEVHFVAQLRVGSTSQSNLVTVTGDGSRLFIKDAVIGYFSGGGNELRVSDGADVVVSNNFFIGEYDGTVGNRVIIEGTGSSITNLGQLYLGRRSLSTDGRTNYSTLIVRDGGRFDTPTTFNLAPNSEGHRILVEDTGSVFNAGATVSIGAYSGSLSDCRLVVTNGGAMIVGGALRTLQFTGDGAQPDIHVSGTGSSVEIGGLLRIGYFNSTNHLVQIDNGGKVTVDGNIRVGADHTSAAAGGVADTDVWTENNTLRVTGSGSELTGNSSMELGVRANDTGHRLEVSDNASVSVGDLFVGQTGTLNRVAISGGGVLETASATIGANAAAENNEATLSGPNSAWYNTGAFFISPTGAEGNTVRVHDQARLESDTFEVGGGGILELSNATVRLTAQDEGITPLHVQDGGLLRGSGAIETDFMGDAQTVLIDGTVSPGFSTGELEIVGNLTFGSTAMVMMEIAGETNFDRIVLDEGYELTFGGTLQLTLLDDYEPQLHDSFRLFVADSYLDIEEMYINDTEAPLQEGWSWQLNNDGSVSVIPEAATTGTMLLGLAFIFACRRRRA